MLVLPRTLLKPMTYLLYVIKRGVASYLPSLSTGVDVADRTSFQMTDS